MENKAGPGVQYNETRSHKMIPHKTNLGFLPASYPDFLCAMFMRCDQESGLNPTDKMSTMRRMRSTDLFGNCCSSGFVFQEALFLCWDFM